MYAYYGRDEDYEELKKRGISVDGYIVLVRYGAIFRGSKVRTDNKARYKLKNYLHTLHTLHCIHLKVKIATKWGAIGVVLFSDPKDKAPDGRNFTFPDSWVFIVCEIFVILHNIKHYIPTSVASWDGR